MAKLAMLKHKRVVLHLILAGCKESEIAEYFEIRESLIKSWKKTHFRELQEILPNQSLLYINTLAQIYNAIEKSRIASLHNKRHKK
ncbi:hypothetical protein LK994_12060 [Ferruginibacter lapsinanis]|uniref:hypothetical protein n=1 Tax=Ferruginibacter lapsinanis TaxID=563172 RepID=UPI001E290164|nr:hypothetical protein [Ferruginibacter lapsinanis]UEG49366.1 hypothetical protein LK994_12060 [Ferruginibacter lapsinanis]